MAAFLDVQIICRTSRVGLYAIRLRRLAVSLVEFHRRAIWWAFHPSEVDAAREDNIACAAIHV